MDSYIGPITNSFINNVIKEFKTPHNKKKIMKYIINPLFCDLTAKFYPHFIIFTIILFVMVIMLTVLLIYIILNK